jgi:hypothetical protein
VSAFKFKLGQQARIIVSGEIGEVIAVAEYLHAENSYCLRYKSADGRANEAWWAESSLQAGEAATTPAPTQSTTPPPIGQPWPGQGGIYAGIAGDIEGGAPGHLILLDGKPVDELSWQYAVKWGQDQGEGARLPTKAEAALLFANLPDAFEKTWHWTGTQYSADYAWYQYFDYGTQDIGFKHDTGRARAVRRSVLESFNPLVSGAV